MNRIKLQRCFSLETTIMKMTSLLRVRSVCCGEVVTGHYLKSTCKPSVQLNVSCLYVFGRTELN